MPARQSPLPLVVSNPTPEISPYFLSISRGHHKKSAYVTNYQHMARMGSRQPKAVNDDNGERSTAFDPWSLSAVLRFSSGAHDATTRTRERLAKIACQGCLYPHAECARLTKTSPELQRGPSLRSAGIQVDISSLAVGKYTLIVSNRSTSP
jgi:hypothetical protein